MADRSSYYTTDGLYHWHRYRRSNDQENKGLPLAHIQDKVGFQDDMEMLANIRKYTDAVIRVDANAGWTLEQAMTKMPVMKSLGVEFVEQPLAKDNWDDMRKLFEYASIPIFADETCVSEHDVEKCAGFFTVLILN